MSVRFSHSSDPDSIYFFIPPGVFLVIYITFSIQSCMMHKSSISIIKDQNEITKVEMKISSTSGLKQIIITDKKVLDSLSKELRNSSEINVPHGGVFNIWADVKIYKQKDIADIFVQNSEFYGWYIDVENKSLKCEYIFKLVEKLH
jgi:hypothetical protein